MSKLPPTPIKVCCWHDLESNMSCRILPTFKVFDLMGLPLSKTPTVNDQKPWHRTNPNSTKESFKTLPLLNLYVEDILSI